jgi:hypothetical protein
MKLDHPSMCAFEHSAGGFGMPDTPTSDEGTYVGPISLHNAGRFVVVGWFVILVPFQPAFVAGN